MDVKYYLKGESNPKANHKGAEFIWGDYLVSLIESDDHMSITYMSQKYWEKEKISMRETFKAAYRKRLEHIPL